MQFKLRIGLMVLILLFVRPVFSQNVEASKSGISSVDPETMLSKNPSQLQDVILKQVPVSKVPYMNTINEKSFWKQDISANTLQFLDIPIEELFISSGKDTLIQAIYLIIKESSVADSILRKAYGDDGNSWSSASGISESASSNEHFWIKENATINLSSQLRTTYEINPMQYDGRAVIKISVRRFK